MAEHLRATNEDVRDLIYRGTRDYCECKAGGGDPEFYRAGLEGLFCEGFDEPPPNNQQFRLWVGNDRFTVTVTRDRRPL